jgi:L-lactate dehydrogenase complex protein LldF
MKAASWALSSGKRLGLVEKGLPLGRLAAGPDHKITKLPGIAAGWTQSRDIPAPPQKSFRDWWAKEHHGPETGGTNAPARGTARADAHLNAQDKEDGA